MVNRDEAGRIKPATTCDEILDAMPAGEPMSTREIADEVGVSRRTALRYLDELANDGVEKKMIDARRAIWVSR